MQYRYFDKDSNRISHEAWLDLNADDDYRIVRRFDNQEMYASLIWVGRITAQEERSFRDCWPLFQLIVKNYNAEGKLIADPVFDGKTFPTQEAAIKGYEDMLVQITDALRKEDGTLDEIGNVLIPPPPPDPNVPVSVIEGLSDDVGAW